MYRPVYIVCEELSRLLTIYCSMSEQSTQTQFNFVRLNVWPIYTHIYAYVLKGGEYEKHIKWHKLEISVDNIAICNVKA